MLNALKEKRIAERASINAITFAQETIVWGFYTVVFIVAPVVGYTHVVPDAVLNGIGAIAVTACWITWFCDANITRWPKIYWIVCAISIPTFFTHIAMWIGGTPIGEVATFVAIGAPLASLLWNIPPITKRGFSQELTSYCLFFPPLSLVITNVDAHISRNPRQRMEP